MATKLGPLVGAIDQGTSSTRFLVSAARRSGRHRGQAAPARPEGSGGFRAFTPLRPGGGLCRALGEGQGNGPAGPGCAVPAATPCVPEERPGLPDPPLSEALPCRGERSRGEPGTSGSRCRSGHRATPPLRASRARSLPAISPRMESNGQGPQALGKEICASSVAVISWRSYNAMTPLCSPLKPARGLRE